jgi:hypothetical protein
MIHKLLEQGYVFEGNIFSEDQAFANEFAKELNGDNRMLTGKSGGNQIIYIGAALESHIIPTYGENLDVITQLLQQRCEDKYNGGTQIAAIQGGEGISVNHLISKTNLKTLAPFVYLHLINSLPSKIYIDPNFSLENYLKWIDAIVGIDAENEYISFQSDIVVINDKKYPEFNAKPYFKWWQPQGILFIRELVIPKITTFQISILRNEETSDIFYYWQLSMEGHPIETPSDVSVEVTPAPVIENISFVARPYNWLIYGAPGTGKSNFLNNESKSFKDRLTRVTFYPDYSYSKFVGSYKPVPYYKRPATTTTFHETKQSATPSNSVVNEPVIDYTFSPGPFLKALVEAVKSEEPYLLIIEELNRANAAAVFGEIFQLLDRDKGVSRYKVKLSGEATAYLREELKENFNVFEDGIFLPANFYIWATMNSADQGVFPLDAAFKRRWSTKYMPLNPPHEDNSWLKDAQIEFDGEVYLWDKFRITVNNFLSGKLKVAEDRLIGPYFLSEEEMKDAESVKYKLILYLRDDVLRHNHSRFFSNGETFQQIMDSYGNGNILKDGIDGIKELLQKAVVPKPNPASESSTPAVNNKTTDETTDSPQSETDVNEAASEIDNDVEIREEENNEKDSENTVKQDQE